MKFYVQTVCETIGKLRNDCISRPHCIMKDGFCTHKSRNSLMYSMKGAELQGEETVHLDHESSEYPLTEDDLGAFFFLYPSKHRKPSWGVEKLKIQDYSVAKLRNLAEDKYGGVCPTCISKHDIVECLQEKMANEQSENLKLMEEKLCR